jgi:hypothetical protein
VGHEYSTVAMVPNDAPSREKHWLIPLSTQRVSSEQKGHEVGMDQIKTCIETLPINNKLIVSLADSKYGSEACRKKVSQTPHWVHLFRLNSTRNIYSPAEDNQQKSDKPIKNKKRYGTKMTLNKPSTHTPPDEVITNSRINHQGQQESISISVWKNQCVRGSRQFKGYENPMTIFKITIIDDQGNARYKNPMWLAVAGQRRHELSATDVFEYYGFRYDIEHFFRFGKDKLLIDAYQTATTKHEEAWWNLASTSYLQLYFARDAVPLLPKKWERHLPIYQKTENHEKTIATPSQTQRAFSIVLDQLGTPAKPCVPRGNPIGRQLGDTQVPRKTHPVIFKAKPAIKLHKNDSVAESEKQDKNSGPEKVKKLVKSVQTQLKNMGYQVDDFHQLLLKATNA